MNHPILRRTVFPLTRLRVRFIEGFENLPKNGPLIVASNHVSYLDPPILTSLLVPTIKQKIHFLTKQSVVEGFGRLIGERWMGMIPVKIDQPAQSLDMAEQYLHANKIVGIFPESSRNTSRELYKGKTGVARLALRTGALVVPIGFEGPPGWTAKQAIANFLFGRERISIRIGA
ncbi:MAG: 1-acyl-sn-glycerol-3-phosphate acyltransferase, partial [Candidatus Kerfeldbacteria bacterium]|nr:1-acyl-sn-glycerol-3-phosphate acyltransferase [Candidatus Kerfeldbacteria bacterium]